MNKDKIEASQMNLKRFISDEGVEIIYYKPSQVQELSLRKESKPSQNLTLRSRIASLMDNCKIYQSSRVETDELLN